MKILSYGARSFPRWLWFWGLVLQGPSPYCRVHNVSLLTGAESWLGSSPYTCSQPLSQACEARPLTVSLVRFEMLKQLRKMDRRANLHIKKGGGGRDRGQGQNARKMTVVNVPRGCQLFPDRFRCWGSLNTNGDITGAAGVFTHSFQVNAPFNNYGPQVNYSGGFSTNAVSGSNYLLGGFSGSSSQIASAPYNRYIILSHEIEVSILSSGSTPNTIPISVGITYSQNSVGTSNMSVTQLPEQPHTRWADVPNSTTAGPIKIAANNDVANLFGLTKKFYEENHQIYGAPAGANPTRTMYVHVWLRAADGTTTAIYYSMTVRHRFLIEFTDLNGFSTTAPSFVESKRPDGPPPSSWFRT